VASHGPYLADLRHLEELDRGIPAARDEGLPVGCERHGADPVLHRLLEAPLILDEKPSEFGGVIVDDLPPMPVVQHSLLATRQDFPDFDLSDVASTG